MKRRLISSGIPADSLVCLDDLFAEESPFMDPFAGVKTPHQQLAFYRKYFHIIVCWVRGLGIALTIYNSIYEALGCSSLVVHLL